VNLVGENHSSLFFFSFLLVECNYLLFLISNSLILASAHVCERWWVNKTDIALSIGEVNQKMNPLYKLFVILRKECEKPQTM